ncbi:MAG: class I tRNA ligase family protein [Hyphomonadaceae bacterium]
MALRTRTGRSISGTLKNKILKDFFASCGRSRCTASIAIMPGWDCHGLPIEWKVEEDFRKQGRKKSEVPAVEFRRRVPRVRRQMHPVAAR